MDIHGYNVARLYTRGFQEVACMHLIRRQYTEMGSPFIDVDFSVILSFPAKMRIGHTLYSKWGLSKYPEAAEAEWEKTGCKINVKKLIFLQIRLEEGAHINAEDFGDSTKNYVQWYESHGLLVCN